MLALPHLVARLDIEPLTVPSIRFIARLLEEKETELAGWRSSAIAPLLCSFPLLTGNFTGKFPKLVALATSETAKNAVVAGFLKEIPYSTEQGIILAEQGSAAREQGILSTKIFG